MLPIGSEVMSGSVASCHRTALLILKGHEDSEEDKEAGVEDWKKQIWNSAFKFSDFVQADETSLASGTMTTQEHSVSSANSEESGNSDEEADA